MGFDLCVPTGWGSGPKQTKQEWTRLKQIQCGPV